MRLARPIGVAAVLLLASTAAGAASPFSAALCSRAGAAHLDHWTLLPQVAILSCYAVGFANHLQERRPNADEIWRIASFLGGMLVLLVALQPPLRMLSHQLFSVHMVQHMLLMLGAAPLLVLSRPGGIFRNALPLGWRAWLARAANVAPIRHGRQWLAHPLSIWLAFCGGFMFWHAPGPHAWGMDGAALGLVEYLTFLVTSIGFWWIVTAAPDRNPLGHGGRLIFLTTAAVVIDLPGALMVFAPQPLYPQHAAGAEAWGLTPLEDQQLAGLIMWVPGGIAFVAVAGLLFLQWLQDAEKRAFTLVRQSPPAVALLLCAGLLLAGCSRSQSEPLSQFGDAQHGAELIVSYGCGGCHSIPRIADAKGNVGPPLDHIGTRTYIAGVLRNSPENLSLWIRDPQQIVPGNAMPQMNISAEDARDITAFLRTLK
jgi:cytochrome c oxidase assembly factor CtaG/cytochrome c2